MSQLSHYILSTVADEDLDEIFDYTERKFGFNQAESYLLALKSVFQLLVENPRIGKSRDEIKAGLRSIPKHAHVIFYTETGDHIRIVRVLHGSQDFSKLLKD